ncbi:MAG: hypothetical protein HEQ40_18140 [Lacibacter sp.]|jgi:predicted RecA/RadA family phage recombinase
MKTTLLHFFITLSGVTIISCSPLKSPIITKNETLENYKYVFITPTNNVNSGSGAVYGGYGASTNRSINPGDVISGILTKNGFIKLPVINPELSEETLIVNYGESGRRNRGLGYTIEVTIQFVSAGSKKQICSCTAEGQGETEADDIRQAITRCLSGLFNK